MQLPVPRMHLFEIDDQAWFPASLRDFVQKFLTAAWTIRVPGLQSHSASQLAADVLLRHLPESSLEQFTFIDFCAGAGGPTPSIEQSVNASLRTQGRKPVNFILTDLHPKVDSWRRVAQHSNYLKYVAQPIDAADAPAAARMVKEANAIAAGRRKSPSKKGRSAESSDGDESSSSGYSTGSGSMAKGPGTASMFRLFNLAFHHFDDVLARRILRNTLETSGGFAIFELQDRSVESFLVTCIFGVGIVLTAPFYSLLWGAPQVLLFSWALPVLPFVLVFDGFISSLRTRTPREVEELIRTCGADEAIAKRWKVRSGRESHMWPLGYMNWIICTPEDKED